jgi:hypothetical protein
LTTNGALDDALDSDDKTHSQAYAPRELREMFVVASFEGQVWHWRDAYEWARLHGVTQILPVTIINHPDRRGGLVGFGVTRQRLRAVLDLLDDDERINSPS